MLETQVGAHSLFSRSIAVDSAKVKCTDHYYVGMPARYKITGTCNAHQGDVRLKHHSSCQSKISNSGFRFARKNAIIFKSMGKDIDSSI
jgi:hypothetical protein